MGIPGGSISVMTKMMMRIMRMVTMVRSGFGARTPYANHCNCSYRRTHDCRSSFRGREIAASDREGCCSKKRGRPGPSSSPSHVREVIPHFGFKKSDVARMWPRKGHFPAREPGLALVNIGLFRLLGGGSQNCHNGCEHPVPSSTDTLGVMLTRFTVWLHGSPAAMSRLGLDSSTAII